MKRIKIIGISIVTVVVIILASLSTVAGYQTVQSTNQIKISNEVNQRELLFQTIVDIVNNKEIQQIILKSQKNSEGLFYPDEKFPTLNTPILTKNQIKLLYFFGSLAARMFSKSKIYSRFEQFQFSKQEMQKEITAVVKTDATLDKQVTQLSNSECDCENEKTSFWRFPILCSILYVLIQICDILYESGVGLATFGALFGRLIIGLIGSGMWMIGSLIGNIVFTLGIELNCWPGPGSV